MDTKASCHFVSNFILIPQQGSTRGFLDYLVPLLKREPNESHLQHAFNACSLASLGNRVGPAQTVDFREKATYEYTLALRRVSLALQHPEESKSDGLLAAVLMLGMFENITAQKMGDFAWGSHIEGAIQIVKARGRKQLRTKTGLGLFIGVRTQLVSYASSLAHLLRQVSTDKTDNTLPNIRHGTDDGRGLVAARCHKRRNKCRLSTDQPSHRRTPC